MGEWSFSKEDIGFDGFSDDKLCKIMQDIIVLLDKETILDG